MDLKTALLQGTKLLDDAGVPEPRLTAEVLLAHAVQHDRVWLVSHATDELIELWWIHYGRYLHQRIEGKPTQQITGKQEFYGREFRVTPDVLIPRPETEHLIEAALELPQVPASIVDVGTGSGCIAGTLTIATKARVFATDISRAALKVAQQNAPEVTFVECDLLAAFRDASFDLVVSNPPYVALNDQHTLQREVREHEPALALYGGNDGLDVYRRLIPEAHRVLRPGGWLLVEIGFTQSEAVSAMLTAWTDVSTRRDLAGLPRVVMARRPA
jgi:release factor glutamine methyltransferase